MMSCPCSYALDYWQSVQLDITSHLIDLTHALQQQDRVQMSELGSQSSEITHMHVLLNIEKQGHQAEATYRAPKAALFANEDAEENRRTTIYWPVKSTCSCLNTKKKT